MDITKLHQLQICSYNCQGLGAGKLQFIQNLCDNSQFIFIQEHWLHESNTHWFDNIVKNIQSHVVSGMCSKQIVEGRAYGGTAILWTDNLMSSVEPVRTHCRRLCAVKVTINNTCLMVCNAYLPSNHDKNTSNLEDFAEVIN